MHHYYNYTTPFQGRRALSLEKRNKITHGKPCDLPAPVHSLNEKLKNLLLYCQRKNSLLIRLFNDPGIL